MMNKKQQSKAIKILKGIVAMADEQNANETGFCDHADTMEIRMLLIEVGALPDRREGKKKCKPT